MVDLYGMDALVGLVYHYNNKPVVVAYCFHCEVILYLVDYCHGFVKSHVYVFL